MSRKFLQILVGTTALTGVAPALAQEAVSPTQAGTPTIVEESGVQDDIVVTARRSDERLQDVPVSVQVVTGETIEKLAITSASEISKLAPGLTLVQGGANSEVTLRGITWQNASGTPSTPIYFNEVPFDPATTIQSLFDVGQIEVLRGPQGTSRGAPSISGAITITTRKPDLDEIGGYIMGLYGEGKHTNLQGAISVPIIKGMLAVRLAANIEDSQGNRVFSVNSAIEPKFKDRSYRATVLFQPTDTLSIQAMYQRRKTLRLSFGQVVGTGSPGSPAASGGLVPAIPANFNGPALTLEDRASVQDLPSTSPEHIDLLTVNAGWEVFGHKLSYNYGRQFTRTRLVSNATDVLNILPGFESFLTFDNPRVPKFTIHEVRVSSLPNPDRPFDYDLGWFSKHSQGLINVSAPAYFVGGFGGAFGAPGTPPGVVTTPDSRYVLENTTDVAIGQVFDSFYGNVRFHLTDRTELSGGLSIVRDRVPVALDVQTFAARLVATPLAALQGAPCTAIPGGANSFYPGFCDSVIPAGVGNATQRNNDKYTAALYNFSLSHKFTDDLLVYATTGTSFRTGLPAINNPGLPFDLVTPEPERATSYEIGAKFSIGRRLRINAAAFQLNYKGQLTQFQGVEYFNTVTQRSAFTSIAFYGNINARVRGVELEIAANPIENLSLGVNLSYTKIVGQGGDVPCNDATRPITALNPINFCPSAKGEVLNQTSPFQATINGSYELPITDSMRGYFRFNVNYRGENPNYGNFRTGPGNFRSTPAHAIVDLFAGVSGDDGAWNLGVYAKNAFDNVVELSRGNATNTIFPFYPAADGYDTVGLNAPREVGVTMRYAFGSR